MGCSINIFVLSYFGAKLGSLYLSNGGRCGNDIVLGLLTCTCFFACFFFIPFRLGKSACPRVLDDQKMAVDDHELMSGRPHDDQHLSYDYLNF